MNLPLPLLIRLVDVDRMCPYPRRSGVELLTLIDHIIEHQSLG